MKNLTKNSKDWDFLKLESKPYLSGFTEDLTLKELFFINKLSKEVRSKRRYHRLNKSNV